ncbi:hypothetical protein FXN61_43390, partial [Lentzea sp. PSKA42]|nr:hypothetical protein [Lentzea indica]
LVLVDSATLVAVCLDGDLGWAWSGAVAAAVLTIRGAWRLYRRRLWLSWLQDLPRSAASTALAFALMSGIGLVSGANAQDVAAVQWAMITFALVIEPVRWCVFAFGRWCRRRFDRCDRTIIVGADEVGVNLARTMLEHPEFGLRPVAFADSGPDPDRQPPMLEIVDGDLADAIVRLRAGTVVLAFSHTRDSPLVDAAITAHRLGCSTLVVPRTVRAPPRRPRHRTAAQLPADAPGHRADQQTDLVDQARGRPRAGGAGAGRVVAGHRPVRPRRAGRERPSALLPAGPRRHGRPHVRALQDPQRPAVR